MNETTRIPMTKKDFITYAENANQEMARLRMDPRRERTNKFCLYCSVDEYGYISWSSLMIGGKLRI